MYLSRHCYDKMHRCPGWAGGGFKYPKVKRCDGGTLWFATVYDDPWRIWRFHKCYRCDVVAIPHILRLLDPKYVWWDLSTGVKWWWRDRVRDHRYQWIDSDNAPWWSLPYSVWKGLRWGVVHRWLSVQDWFTDLYRWYAPKYRGARIKMIEDTRKHYFRES